MSERWTDQDVADYRNRMIKKPKAERRLHCSCGAAVSKEEYEFHVVRGHDAGVPKRRKYGNTPTYVGELRFDSKKEAARWADLVLLWQAGKIDELKRQVPFVFEYNGERIGTYKSDFTYVENGRVIVEDVKSVATRDLGVYRLKKRLMKAFFAIEIRET